MIAGCSRCTDPDALSAAVQKGVAEVRLDLDAESGAGPLFPTNDAVFGALGIGALVTGLPWPRRSDWRSTSCLGGTSP